MLTVFDKKRKEELLSKKPELSKIEDQITSRSDVTDFIINTDPVDWEARQFIHIVANENGWNSKKIATYMDSSDYRCSKCYHSLVPPKDPEPTFCCLLCDGKCPSNCHDFFAERGGDGRKMWRGDILLSKRFLKLGRKARRRRNRWRNGLITDVYS